MTDYPISNGFPLPDSSANRTSADVIGNKSDTHAGTNLMAHMVHILQDIDTASKVYPTLAAGVTVTGAAGAWTLGNFAVVVPADTITSEYSIHFVNIAEASASDTYELVFYSGADASEVEVGRIRFTRALGSQSTAPSPIKTTIIAANSQLKAKIASSGGGSDTAIISIFYHIHT